ncbi:hypothetical protein AA0119_g11489 [Alternaria tenuissima]|uniref:DUF7924 domain-containing protein n=2 Tax=Alternaria alternata complex TaxID=187734 RepID=A0A4Q4N0V3_ALTAL|nr:hypothetical protein AA0115_g11998 [Alternaria tenuissima]RYN64925.1 hypothetical protein AA0117_g12368 [Alternaria alternata]RYN35572.1 hypothetical protein AA0114_g11723 [Alternaria tenuissima]RYN89302.1 hypothetical protein AA0119_g11489 [Alternaria tenuissima]RYO05936.1 hypothetical protein AA0121_g12253 [Alternaria tenuissima]
MPKPDIAVGISREAFSRTYAGLLDYWQAGKAVFSDPHATQGDMRFYFFIIKAKGLVAHGNLIGAQSQAIGAGKCAIRLLESLAAQDPGLGAPRIVINYTTEGAMHELLGLSSGGGRQHLEAAHNVLGSLEDYTRSPC